MNIQEFCELIADAIQNMGSLVQPLGPKIRRCEMSALRQFGSWLVAHAVDDDYPIPEWWGIGTLVSQAAAGGDIESQLEKRGGPAWMDDEYWAKLDKAWTQIKNGEIADVLAVENSGAKTVV